MQVVDRKEKCGLLAEKLNVKNNVDCSPKRRIYIVDRKEEYRLVNRKEKCIL